MVPVHSLSPSTLLAHPSSGEIDPRTRQALCSVGIRSEASNTRRARCVVGADDVGRLTGRTHAKRRVVEPCAVHTHFVEARPLLNPASTRCTRCARGSAGVHHLRLRAHQALQPQRRSVSKRPAWKKICNRHRGNRVATNLEAEHRVRVVPAARAGRSVLAGFLAAGARLAGTLRRVGNLPEGHARRAAPTQTDVAGAARHTLVG